MKFCCCRFVVTKKGTGGNESLCIPEVEAEQSYSPEYKGKVFILLAPFELKKKKSLRCIHDPRSYNLT